MPVAAVTLNACSVLGDGQHFTEVAHEAIMAALPGGRHCALQHTDEAQRGKDKELT